MQISAELVDARDNSHIWGQQYSRKSSDLSALQGELAKEITSMLRTRLTGDDVTGLVLKRNLNEPLSSIPPMRKPTTITAYY